MSAHANMVKQAIHEKLGSQIKITRAGPKIHERRGEK